MRGSHKSRRPYFMPVAVLLSQSLETGPAATSDCQTQISRTTVGFHSERMTAEVLRELHSPATPKAGKDTQRIVSASTAQHVHHLVRKKTWKWTHATASASNARQDSRTSQRPSLSPSSPAWDSR